MEDGERAFRCAASWGNIPPAWQALADMYDPAALVFVGFFIHAYGS